VVYYAKTKQRIRVPLDSETYSAAAALVRKALETSAAPTPPAPLEDSPKCIRCSLAVLCLPDETNALLDADGEVCAQLSLFGGPEPVPRKPVRGEVRRLMAPRDDLKPLYVNTQGLHIGKSGTVLQVKEKGNTIQTVRMGETCQVNLMGNVQLTTQAIQGLCEAGIPICYFSQGGWFYGITTGLCTKNVFLRQRQFELAAKERFALELACSLTAGKIRNQRTCCCAITSNLLRRVWRK
jgi:CRISPR-associated protein Cas1